MKASCGCCFNQTPGILFRRNLHAGGFSAAAILGRKTARVQPVAKGRGFDPAVTPRRWDSNFSTGQRGSPLRQPVLPCAQHPAQFQVAAMDPRLGRAGRDSQHTGNLRIVRRMNPLSTFFILLDFTVLPGRNLNFTTAWVGALQGTSPLARGPAP